MKVFTNGIEWWVARDMEHLAEIYLAATGLELTDDDALGDDGEWSECPLTSALRIVCDENGRPSDSGEGVTRTMAEWVALEGEGLLAGTEY